MEKAELAPFLPSPCRPKGGGGKIVFVRCRVPSVLGTARAPPEEKVIQISSWLFGSQGGQGRSAVAPSKTLWAVWRELNVPYPDGYPVSANHELWGLLGAGGAALNGPPSPQKLSLPSPHVPSGRGKGPFWGFPSPQKAPSEKWEERHNVVKIF